MGEEQMENKGRVEDRRRRKTFIPRLMPIGAAVILLMILVHLFREEQREKNAVKSIEAPLAMKIYSTAYARPDSLANEGVRLFGRKDYGNAARCFAEAHFYWNSMIREGRETRYPEDLRFFYALSQFYRGRPELAVPLLEEEKNDAPSEPKYSWYLAHAYLALGHKVEARRELERVLSLGGEFEKEAREKLALIEAKEARR